MLRVQIVYKGGGVLNGINFASSERGVSTTLRFGGRRGVNRFLVCDTNSDGETHGETRGANWPKFLPSTVWIAT